MIDSQFPYQSGVKNSDTNILQDIQIICSDPKN